MSKKPLYQPWNEEEFRADVRVISMSPLQRYLYRTLLQASFFCSTRPYLPNNDEQLFQLAWCESKKQWDTTKVPILKMFTAVEISGEKLLKHKRVLSDWQRITKKRKALAKAGQKGGEANATARLKQGCSREGKRREAKEKVREGEEIDVSFKNNITDTSLELLGVRISPDDSKWTDMNSYKRVKGQPETEEAFEKWAEVNQGNEIRYPLSEFLKVSERYFERFTPKVDPKPLVLELAFLSDGGVTFTQKQSLEIARLLEVYPEADIKAAFVEFIGGLDDYSRKFAAKDFTEKAEQFIYTQRRQKQQQELTSKLVADTIVTERSKVESELAKLPPGIDLSKFEL